MQNVQCLRPREDQFSLQKPRGCPFFRTPGLSLPTHDLVNLWYCTNYSEVQIALTMAFPTSLLFDMQSGTPGVYRVATKFDRQNPRIIQGCFKDILVIFKDVKTLRKCRVAAPIRKIRAQCITLRAKFKDFKDDLKKSRTFQGYSKILNKIQGPFKDFKDRH